MDRERFILRFGHWGVPGASGEMQGMRQMPSATSVKSHRVAFPYSFHFRRAHILVLLASPWDIPQNHKYPCTHTCEWATSWAEVMDPRESGGLFSWRGWFSCPHIGVQCCLRCPRVSEMPQLTLRHSPGPREWPHIFGPAAKPDRAPTCTVLGAYMWTAELSLDMSWRVWQAPADFTACRRSWNTRLPYGHWNSGARIISI